MFFNLFISIVILITFSFSKPNIENGIVNVQVFQVFLRWSDGISCGAMVDDDIVYLRDHLLMLDFAVLPAFQDKWVSLHPSFGLVCWVDDNKLKKQFKHSDNIEFLYFGDLTSEEKQMLQTKVSVLMQKLGIPSLSEVRLLFHLFSAVPSRHQCVCIQVQ